MVPIERQRGILYEWPLDRSPSLTILNKETHETQKEEEKSKENAQIEQDDNQTEYEVAQSKKPNKRHRVDHGLTDINIPKTSAKLFGKYLYRIFKIFTACF